MTGSDYRCGCCRRAICPTPQPKPFFDLLDRRYPTRSARRSSARSGSIRSASRATWRSASSSTNAILRFVAHARAGLRLQLAHLPIVDGRHVGRPADRRDPVPAQSDPSDAAARRSRRRLRQGPRRCRPISGRAARARCARRPARSWRCATASATHVEQRTTMLAGVSHDLRTVLTRFKLELALLGDTG